MKILILANDDVGLYKFRKELIEELISQDHEVAISLPYGKYVDPFIDMGCTFFDTPIDRRGINPKTDLRLFKRYRQIIVRSDPDMVITYTIKPNIYGGIASCMRGKKYSVNITGLGTAFEKKGILRTIVVVLYRLALRRAEKVFVENSSIKRELLRHHICGAGKICVLNGAGVNTSYYSYLEYPKNPVFRFLYVGRVMKEKGMDELLLAMHRLKTEGYNVILDVVGRYEDDYTAVINRYREEGWLKYNGFRDDVRPYIAACDCFVLPSYHEGMANTNLESASCGRPLITSDIPGCREAVVDGATGFLCKSKDADSLYEAMKKMLSTEIDTRRAMGIAGREHMRRRFDKKYVVNNTLRTIDISRNSL
ncbi:MAG: glycosyltransferase family 4 protein [Lachnospiraceae bacterium]|nr:glycosyltransferase family 4 protein [Lachnospiraceae bacterium]